MTLDKSGYVRKVEPVQPAAPEPATTAAPTPHHPIDRETAITRMATLNTATAILSSGNRAVKLDDVLAVAERLEAWVNRA